MNEEVVSKEEKERLEAIELLKTTPRFSHKYNVLRRKAMTQKELRKFESECLSSWGISKLLNVHEKTVREIVNEFGVPNQFFSGDVDNHRNGKPMMVYHPSDIEPFLFSLPARKLTAMVMNKEHFEFILEKNESLRHEITRIINIVEEKIQKEKIKND